MKQIKGLDEFLNLRKFESTFKEEEGDTEYEFEDESQEEEEESDEISYLKYLIRKLFSGNNIEADVEFDYSGEEIYVFAFPEKRENMKNLLGLFDAAMKLKKDILPQYKVSYELYQTAKKEPIFQFTFELNPSTSKTKYSYRDDDDLPY